MPAARVDARTVMSPGWLVAVACLVPPLVAQGDQRTLMRFQAADGRFAALAGEAGPEQDVMLTALAAFCIMGDGSTLRSGPNRDPLMRTTKWLVSRLDAKGRFVDPVGGHDLAGDAVATWTLLEAYGLSGQPHWLQEPCARASGNLLREVMVERLFGKRDAPHEDVLRAWVIGAYKACKDFGVHADRIPWDRVRGWADRLARPAAGFHDTVAMLAWIYADGAGGDMERLRAKATAILERQGRREERAEGLEPEEDFHTSVALFQLGGEHWNAWHAVLERVILKTQLRGGEVHGTWDPPPSLARRGGRLQATFCNILSLTIYYRYARFVR
jgi:hypothetical protein